MAGHLPLNALRVFEACARHGSFLKAADELAITPGAVSRHIKGLEAELEVRLFDRFNRAVRLTEAGERLAVGVRQGMTTLQGAVDQARTRRDAPLVVSVGHSLAAKWLAPRLHLFEERHPDVPVLIWASDTVVDLARDGVDIAIRNGRGGRARMLRPNGIGRARSHRRRPEPRDWPRQPTPLMRHAPASSRRPAPCLTCSISRPSQRCRKAPTRRWTRCCCRLRA